MTKKTDYALKGWRGKMAGNAAIERNINAIAAFDRRHEALVVARNRDGLLALAKEVEKYAPRLAVKARATAQDLP